MVGLCFYWLVVSYTKAIIDYILVSPILWRTYLYRYSYMFNSFYFFCFFCSFFVFSFRRVVRLRFRRRVPLWLVVFGLLAWLVSTARFRPFYRLSH